MPRLLDRQKVEQDSNTNTCVGVAPLTYASAGDLAIWACYINARGGAPTAPTGWTEISFTDNDSDQFTLRVYRRTLQAGDTAPTLTHNFNCTNVNIMFFFDAGTFDSTTPIDGNADDIDTTEALKEIPSDTPSENNCGMLSLSAMDNNLAPIAEGNTTVLELGHGTALSYYAGYTCLVDTTATEVVNVHCTGGDDSIQSTILIRDNSPTAPTHSPYAPHFNSNFNFVAIMTDERLTTSTAESARDPTLNGLTTVDGKSITYDGGGVEFDDGLFPYLETWEMQIGSGSNYEGFELILGSTTDMSATGYQLGVHYVTGGPSSTFPTEAEGGFVMVLRSADTGGPTYNWKAYQMFSSEAVDLGSFRQCAMIEPGNAAAYELDTSGTLDLSAVTHVSFLFAQPASGSGYTIRLTELLQVNPLTICGGSSGDEITFDNFYDQVTKVPALSVVKQGANQYLCKQPIRIGLNGHYAHFLDQNLSLEFAAQTDTANGIAGMNISDNLLGFEINLEDSNGNPNISLTNSSVASVDAFHFRVKDYTTTQSNITTDFTNLLISGPGETEWDDLDIAHSGITFVGRDEFNYTGANMSGDFSGGCIFDGTPVRISSEAHLDNLNNCTLQNNTTAITITGDQSGTWTDPSLTVSGNTYDIEYTGTTNFTIESATTLTVNNSSSGVLTISTPTVSFTLNSSESGSDLKIFDTNTQTIESSATGTTTNTTAAGTYDWTVQKAGFLPQRGTGVVLSGTSVTVDVTLIEDPIYNASHGLVYGTDYSYNAATRVTTIVANQEGRDIYSAAIDDFISEASLRNCPFPYKAIGPDRIDFLAIGYYNSAVTVGATIDSGDVQFWKGAGMEWEHDTTGNPTKKFYSIKSSNTLQTGSVVGFTQVNQGTPTECTLVSDKVNQVIQFFEDTNGDGTPDYNYTGHLLFKGFKTGYYQARWDTINDGGVTTLEPYEYNISLLQAAIAGTTGDQSITITTLTDHTSSPLVVGSKNFDYELVDPGVNTAEDLLAQVNYDVFNAVDTLISGTLYTSYQAFDLPDMVVEAGSNIETKYGPFEGDGLITDLSGVYLSRASADHPDIARFQSNDGLYYTPAVTANISITGMPTAGANIRLQVHNETAKTASAWAATTAYAQGDKVLRSTGVGSEQTAGLYFVATTGGTSGGSEPTWDTTVGNTTADGSVTWTCYAILYYDADPSGAGYSDSYTDGEEFSDGDTYRVRFAELNGATSFKIYETTGLTTSSGFTVAVSPTADSVYAANAVDGSSTAVMNKFTADYVNDEIDLDANQDFAVTEAFAFYCYELTTSQGMYEFWGGVTAIDVGNYRNNTSVISMYFDETAGFVKQTDSARWFRDDDTRPVIDPTTGGAGLELNWRNPVYIAETGVSGLTGSESTELFKNSTILTNLATVDTNVDDIKTKTDQLTFTKANELDANIQSVNDVTVTGTGASGDEWGP